MTKIRQPLRLLQAFLVVIGIALARYVGIPDWAAILVLGGGSAVAYLIARMMGYPREPDSPAPMRNRLPGGPSERWP